MDVNRLAPQVQHPRPASTTELEPGTWTVVHGRRGMMFVVAILAVAVGEAVGLASATSVHLESTIWTEAETVGVMSVVGGLGLYTLWRDTIREVRLGDAGVLLRTGGRDRLVPWQDLLPFRYPVTLGGLGLEYKTGVSLTPEAVSGIMITPKQALAIVSHPLYPKLPVPPQLLQAMSASS